MLWDTMSIRVVPRKTADPSSHVSGPIRRPKHYDEAHLRIPPRAEVAAKHHHHSHWPHAARRLTRPAHGWQKIHDFAHDWANIPDHYAPKESHSSIPTHAHSEHAESDDDYEDQTHNGLAPPFKDFHRLGYPRGATK